MAQQIEWFRARYPREEDRKRPTVDGDTIWLELDMRLRYYHLMDLRLYNTWAPEKGELGYDETQEFAFISLKLMDDKKKWPFWVATRSTVTYEAVLTFGRWVSEIYDRERTHSLNTAINNFVINNGYPRGQGYIEPKI